MELTQTLQDVAGQPDFFSEMLGQELLEPEEQQRGKFTGEVVARNMQRYRAIVEALGADLPVRTICAAFNVSSHNVKVIREREAELIATQKKRRSALLGETSRKFAESLLADLVAGKVPVMLEPVAVGIPLDKKAGLDGEANVRIEVAGRTVPNLADVPGELPAVPPSEGPSDTNGAKSQ